MTESRCRRIGWWLVVGLLFLSAPLACTAGVADRALLDKGNDLCFHEIAARSQVHKEQVIDLAALIELHHARSTDFGPVRTRIRELMEAADERQLLGTFWRTWEEDGRTVFGELLVRLDVGGSYFVCRATVEPNGKGLWDVKVTPAD